MTDAGADEVDDALRHDRVLPGGVDHLRQPLESVADSDGHASTPRFFSSVSTCNQNLATSGPDVQEVTLPRSPSRP